MSSQQTTVGQALVLRAAAPIHRLDSLVNVPLVRYMHKEGALMSKFIRWEHLHL